MVFLLLFSLGCLRDNPRTKGRPVDDASGGVRHATGSAYERLKNEVENFTVSDLDKAELGEEIEYLLGYVQKKSHSFPVSLGKCRFEYQKVKLTERIIEENSKLKIQSESKAFEFEYTGLPMRSLKELCEEKAAENLTFLETREIDLPKSFEDYKKYIHDHIFSVVEKCEAKESLRDGKCLELELEVKRELETLFQDIIVYKIKSTISFPDGAQSYSMILNLTRPYFSYFGLISQAQRGAFPSSFPKKTEINSLELLRWVKK